MDEYAVLVDSVVRDALGLDGARGAGDAPAEPLTAPTTEPFCTLKEWADYGDGDPRNPWAQCAARDRARLARAEAGRASEGE